MPSKKKIAQFPGTVETATESVPIEGIEDERLVALAKHGATDLVAAVRKHEAQIIQDIDRLKEDEGDKAKFKIGLSITLNLGDETIETSTSYSVKLVEKADHAIKPDNHPDMFREET